jgi:hypothetical protein
MHKRTKITVTSVPVYEFQKTPETPVYGLRTDTHSREFDGEVCSRPIAHVPRDSSDDLPAQSNRHGTAIYLWFATESAVHFLCYRSCSREGSSLDEVVKLDAPLPHHRITSLVGILDDNRNCARNPVGSAGNASCSQLLLVHMVALAVCRALSYLPSPSLSSPPLATACLSSCSIRSGRVTIETASLRSSSSARRYLSESHTLRIRGVIGP